MAIGSLRCLGGRAGGGGARGRGERALAAHTAGRHEQAFAWATELSERYDDSTAAAALAVLTGVVLGAARAGGVVVLDGLAASLPAVVASRLEPGVQGHLIAGQVSREKAHALVLRELGLEPLLSLRLRSGEGVGACLAASLVLQTLAMRRVVARTR